MDSEGAQSATKSFEVRVAGRLPMATGIGLTSRLRLDNCTKGQKRVRYHFLSNRSYGRSRGGMSIRPPRCGPRALSKRCEMSAVGDYGKPACSQA